MTTTGSSPASTSSAARRADAGKEAGDAADYYGEKFKGIFKEAGVGASKAGDKAGEAAEKLSEWLKR